MKTPASEEAKKTTVQIKVYADLNCPYCYVLNERLEKMGLSRSVIWLPVEHAPDLYDHSFTDLDRQDLVREVDDVQSKAPDITLNLPDTRPNSRLASKLLATIIDKHPDKAADFRTAVYRALWQQGEDISDPDVLNRLLTSCGLSELEPAASADDVLLVWHTDWEHGQFARNIPSMESSSGFKLLGFPPKEQLEQFLTHGNTKVTDFTDASCVSSDRYLIALVSENTENWPQPKLLDAISYYRHYPTPSSLSSPGHEHHKLDMIVLCDNQQTAVRDIKYLKHSKHTQHLPIFLLSSDKNIQIEAFRSGAADVAHSHVDEEILGHRMVRILRMKRNSDKLFEIARVDALTGLYNRREFDATMEREWRNRQREKKTISLLMIDLDNFKSYNDTYGHSMGDDVLRRFSRILESCIHRPTDLVVRHGGEEFAIILPGVGIEGAKHVAELIREQTETHDIKHSASPTSSHITVSIGVAEAKSDEDPKLSIKKFINFADEALYSAKGNGRNQVCAYTGSAIEE